MGCGQSKIGSDGSKKDKKSKSGSKRNGFSSSRSASLTQRENGRNRRPDSGGSEANRNDANDDRTRRPVPPGGPLVRQTEVSTGQIDFFRMLDEKIENGPDFDENDDSYSILNHLKSPRAKSLASSTLASLPQREAATTTTTTTTSSSSGTTVAGSGGAKRRPSSTPITIKRSSHDADKIDGISSDQRHHHHHQGAGNGAGKLQTANLPKHLLEPIAQSPKSYTSTRTSPPDQDEAQSSSGNKRSSSSTATRTSPQQQSSQSGGCDFGVKIRGRLKGAERLEQCVKESRLVPECDRPVPMVYPYRPDQDSRTYERIHGTGNSCDFGVRMGGRATGAEALEQAIELQRKRSSSASSSSSAASTSSSSSSSRSSRSSAVSSYQPEPPENPLVAAFDENTLAMQRDAERRRQRQRNHQL